MAQNFNPPGGLTYCEGHCRDVFDDLSRALRDAVNEAPFLMCYCALRSIERSEGTQAALDRARSVTAGAMKAAEKELPDG